nr:hypothetical protein [Tanacetum cinerariifolium]
MSMVSLVSVEANPGLVTDSTSDSLSSLEGDFDMESKAAQSYDSVALNIGDRLPPQTS